MSTPLHPDDLDRTDELPQLDVVAYEAAQASGATDPLSTTDTWLVDSLGESGGTETIVRTGQSAFPLPGGVDLSLNLARLRQRISTLEEELEAARSAAHEAEAASRVPNAERTELNSRIAALEAQNQHLREQSGIAEALMQRLQQQLRDQVETHKSQLAKADELRETDRRDAERQRLSLEQQLEASTANFTSTADEQERLKQALEESREMAARRARQIDELQRVVISEQGKAHALGRNLAAKLADYDIMSSMVSQRNAAIGSLERTRDDLNAQLQKAFDDARQLSTLLDDANKRAAAHDALSAEISARDEQIAQLGIELDSLRHQLEQARTTHEALETNLTEATATAAGGQERQQTLQAQVSQLEASLAAMTRERDGLLDTRQTLQSRDEQLAQLGPELESTRLQLEHAQLARETLETNLADATSQAARDQEQVRALQARITELEANLQSVSQERDELRSAHEQLAARDQQLAQLGRELETTRTQLEQAQHSHQALETHLSEAAARAASAHEQQQTVQSRIAELEAALLAVTSERDDLLGTRDALAARTADVERLTAELDETRRNAAVVWSELETHSRTAGERQKELDAAHVSIEEMQRANEDLRNKLERLHAVAQDDTQLLTERTNELSQVRVQMQKLVSDVAGLESSLNARDSLIDTLRTEIRTAQEERSIMSEQLAKARSRVKTMTQQIFNRDNRIATLKADLAVHIEALAAIRQDVDRIDAGAIEPAQVPVERFLEPVNHGGEAILLNRRVMTVGRTNENDIYIPSKMISRHHARLLVGPNAVIVEDAGSTNGCYVNDQLVKQHVLHEGDVLAIGDMKFRLRVRSLASPEAAPAPIPSLDDEYRDNE